MTKRIMILILSLPLLLMISIFTTSNSVSNMIDVPVTGLEIIGNNIVYLDLDANEKYQVNYTVYPTNANQEVKMTTEAIGDARLAELEFVDGYIIPKKAGEAKVYLTTVDGGFKDSFIVYVYSEQLTAIESSVETNVLYVGQTTKIFNSFIPEDAKDKLIDYSSSNENACYVDEQGIIHGIGKGQAVITVFSINNPDIKSEIIITVLTDDFLSLGQTEIYTWNDSGIINVTVDLNTTYDISYQAYDSSNNVFEDIIVTFSDEDINGNFTANYTFINEDFIGSVTIKITIETNQSFKTSKDCIIHKTDNIEASFEEEYKVLSLGSSSFLYFILLPKEASVSYDLAVMKVDSIETSNIISASMAGNRILVKTNTPGICTLALTIKNSKNVLQSKTIKMNIVVKPRTIVFDDSAKTYGIEGIYTIGGINYNGSGYKLSTSFGGNIDDSLLDYISFESSNDSVMISDGGVIEIKDSNFVGVVDFTCTFAYKDFSIKSASYSLRIVADGVNVYNYIELLSSINNNKRVVLQANIKDDFGYDVNGKIVYSEMETTYDKQYYINTNNEANAKVKVLLNIKNDLYGNGYEINAHNVAYGLDSNGQLKDNALFRGPLNFVSLTTDGTSAINVKAQDNIAFAIFENVTLNNVSLKSCDLISDSNGAVDLLDLHYVGTTLEVLGDNVNIEYSRISNGRTTIRAFGDINDEDKVIHVNIKNSVLSGAREFVLRIGSNKFVAGNKDNPAPKLPNDALTKYPASLTYRNMNDSQKAAYDNEFIKTFVNVKNTVIKDSGIFSIGIDSHFSGPALADGDQFAPSITKGTWTDLAKTSYGAKLTFQEDVRIFDWKKLDDVDSSSLIETIGDLESMGIDLTFNIKEMVENVSTNEKFKDIVYVYNGEKYVHGGIAFFGGGKNYGVVDYENYSFYDLNGYIVNLDDVDKVELKLAAGEEPFYFLLHDATTKYFLPAEQNELIKNGEGYSIIYPKKNA